MESKLIPTLTRVSIDGSDTLILTYYSQEPLPIGSIFLSELPGFTQTFAYGEGFLIGENVIDTLSLTINELGELIINSDLFQLNANGELIYNGN